MIGVFCFALFCSVASGTDDTTDHLTTCMIQSPGESLMKKTALAAVSSCANDWGEFDETQMLTRTQWNHDTALPEDFYPYLDTPPGAGIADNVGLFILPKHNFAICIIPKVGSSMWNDILLKMVLNDPSADGNKSLFDEELAAAAKGTPEQKRSIFSDPAATRAVFVREPLSRFASAFLDKCVTENPTTNVHFVEDMCPPMLLSGSGERVTMKTAVDWYTTVNKRTLDEHWLPQSYICQLDTRVSEYTVVGLYSEDNYGNDASCLMEVANISYFNSKGPEYGNAPYWEDVDTATLVPPNNYHVDTDAAEQLMLQKLFTKEGARRLIGALAVDYDTFHFPREPAWVIGATGEWYEMLLDPEQAPQEQSFFG